MVPVGLLGDAIEELRYTDFSGCWGRPPLTASWKSLMPSLSGLKRELENHEKSEVHRMRSLEEPAAEGAVVITDPLTL